MKKTLRIKVKRGWQEVEDGGVFTLSFPGNREKRRRLIDGGRISPAITASGIGVVRAEIWRG